MEVIFLTTLFSVVFAIFFLLLFLRMRQGDDSCADQDSLIPFRESKREEPEKPSSASDPFPSDQ